MESLIQMVGENAVSVEFDCDFVLELDDKIYKGLQKIFNRLASIERILGKDYDLDRLGELVEAERDGRSVAMSCKSGSEVWVLERDEDGEVYDISGNVLICEVNGYCIVSGYINGCGDIDYILSDQAAQTVVEYNGTLAVYPACDCYKTRKEAEAALNEMREGETE